MKFKTEPAVVTSVIVAVLGFIAPTVVVGDTQKALITGAITAVFAILGGLHIRGRVTPASVAEAAKAEAAQASKEAVVYARLHPEQVDEIVKEVQSQAGRQKLEQEAIAALTTGPHPMTFEPGADSTVPLPEPQGTYSAADNPIHATYVPTALTPVPVTMPPVANGSTPIS